MEKEKIVFFDGICNLCTGTIHFLLKANLKKNLKFASLQSSSYEARFGGVEKGRESIVYWNDGIVYKESTAVLLIARELVFPLSIISILIILPRFFRDAVYRYVSRNRYFIFGKRIECWLPSEELRDRFLN